MTDIKKAEKSGFKFKTFAFVVLDLILLLLLLTVGMASSAVTFLCVALISASFFFKPYGFVVADLLFFYPFYNMFKLGGSGVSYYNIIIACAIIIPFITGALGKGKGLIFKYDMSFLLLLIICLYMLIINLIEQSSLGLFQVAFDVLIPMLLVICVISQKDKVDLRAVIYAFSFGILIASFYGSGLFTSNYLSAYIQPLPITVGSISLNRLQGLTVNPNYFSIDVNLAIAGLLALAPIQKRKYKPCEIILICILIFAGIMSLSKSFIMGCIATFFVWLISQLALKRGSTGVVILVTAIVVILLILTASDGTYIVALFNRFSETGDSINALTSSRWNIWMGYIDYFFKNPSVLLMGSGIIANDVVISGALPRASHSFYIECLYYLGFVGSLLMVWFIKTMVWKFKTHRNIYNYLPLLVFLVRGLAINLLLREAFMISMILICLFMNYADNFEIERKEHKFCET